MNDTNELYSELCPFCQEKMVYAPKGLLSCPTINQTTKTCHFTKTRMELTQYASAEFYEFFIGNHIIQYWLSSSKIIHKSSVDGTWRKKFYQSKDGTFDDYINYCKRIQDLILFL